MTGESIAVLGCRIGLAEAADLAVGVVDGVAVEHFVNGLIAGDKGQAVGSLKTFLGQRAAMPV